MVTPTASRRVRGFLALGVGLVLANPNLTLTLTLTRCQTTALKGLCNNLA